MTPEELAWRVRQLGKDVSNAIVGAFLVGGFAGLITVTLGPAALAVGGITGAAVAGWALRDVHRKRWGLFVAALNTSFNLIALGKLGEAEALLQVSAREARFAWILRLADIQQAVIAIRRGDMAAAERHLDAAIARPLGRIAKDDAWLQIEGAHALRAFVRAALGRREVALKDIALVRGSPSAGNDALARVALAEAMLLERSGERDELRALLERDRDLLLEHTHPRERAIVRAFQRMLRAATGSVYRQTAPREPEPGAEEPKLSDWVAKIAPGAAPFVRSPRAAAAASAAPADALAVPAATERGRRAVQAAREQSRPRRSIGLAALGLTIAAGLALLPLWMVLNHDVARAGSGVTGALATSRWLGVGVLALLATGVVMALFARAAAAWRRRARPGRSRRVAAQAGRAAGRREPTERELQALTDSPSDVIAAQARLMLAGAAERRGDLAAALENAGRGLGRLTDARSRAAADIIYPDLVSLRAFALAACDRGEEADAELAMLGPGYPHHARAVFRVRLVQRLRARDLDGAAAWALQSEADLPLSVREELLADLARAAAAPEQAGAGEAARLRDELRAAPELRAWVSIVAPGLLDAFSAGRAEQPPGARLRVELPGDPGAEAQPDGPRAEAELDGSGAEAELEAAEALGPPAAPALRRA